LSLALTTLILGGGSAVDAPAAPVTATDSDSLVDSIGVNIHSTHYLGFPSTSYDDWDSVISALGNLGIRHVRDHVFDPTRLNAVTAATGAKVTGIIEQHTFVNGILALDQTSIPALLNTAKQVTGLEALEGPNEYDQDPDPNWQANLRLYQTALFTGARADPALKGLPILAPSLSSNHQAAFADLAPYADYGNFHFYPLATTPTSGLSSVMSTASTMAGGKPLWATETGYHYHTTLTANQYDISQAAAAKYIPRMVLDNYRLGVQRSFLYELVDDNADPTDSNPENNFGLYNSSFGIKAAGTALKNLITLLADPGNSFAPASLDYTLSGGNANLRQVLFQKHDGTFWLALWQDVSVFDKSTNTDLVNPNLPVTITFPSAINGAAAYLPDSSIDLVQRFGPTTQINLGVPDQVMLLEVSLEPLAPEPGSAGLLIAGLGGWALRRRRRRSA
jgi:hypothetical protein